MRLSLATVSTEDLVAELRKRRGQYDPVVLHRALFDLHGIPVRDAVAKAFDLPAHHLYGSSRTARISTARFACYAILRERGLSLMEIAEVTGRSQHGSVMSGLIRAGMLKKNDADFSQRLTHARQLMAGDSTNQDHEP